MIGLEKRRIDLHRKQMEAIWKHNKPLEKWYDGDCSEMNGSGGNKSRSWIRLNDTHQKEFNLHVSRITEAGWRGTRRRKVDSDDAVPTLPWSKTKDERANSKSISSSISDDGR